MLPSYVSFIAEIATLVLVSVAGQPYKLNLVRCNTSADWTIASFVPIGKDRCPGPAFNLKQLDSIENSLREKWGPCSGSPQELWAQEWNHHGTCTALDELSFFSTVMQLYDHNFKYCSSSATHCFFCFNSNYKPVARLQCMSPSPTPSPGPPGPSPMPGAHYYHLELERCRGSQTWSIHGLWPEWAIACPGAVFDIRKLADLRPRLDNAWRLCPEYNSTFERFWGHEWEEHGRCSGMDETTFFAETMKLYNANMGACPGEAGAKSCYFCFDSNFSQVDRSLCRRPHVHDGLSSDAVKYI